MKYSEKTCLVFDNGGYVEVAKTLSKDFKKVYYFTPWQTGFPTSNDTLIGSGFKEFERTNHFWDKIDEVDLFVFTDIMQGDLQEYLVKQGKRVWGSRGADRLEISRYEFFEYIEKLGLPIPKTELVIGIENLRKHLQKTEDKFVKLDSMFRGDIETFHHINYEITEPLIDKLEYEVGARKNNIKFIVQDPIPTKAEIGYDGYTIDGKYAKTALFGIEVKDSGYIGEVRKYEDLPKHIITVNEALSKTFEAYGYRGFFSSEIRVGEDDKPYFIDITARCPAPPTSIILEIIENLAEIIWEGADGNLVEPIFKAKFGAECMGLLSDFSNYMNFAQIFYPESEKDFIKQPYSCVIEGKTYVVPQRWKNPRICEVVAIGDDLEKVISELQERCGTIKAHKLNLDCSVLNDAIEELRKL